MNRIFSVHLDALGLQQRGQDAEAKRLLQKIEQLLAAEPELTPDLLSVKYSTLKSLAEIHDRQGNLPTAISLYVKAANIDHTELTLFFSLAHCAARATNLKMAYFAYKQVLLINPTHILALNNTLPLAFAFEDYQTVLSCILSLNEKWPTNSSLHQSVVVLKKIFPNLDSLPPDLEIPQDVCTSSLEQSINAFKAIIEQRNKEIQLEAARLPEPTNIIASRSKFSELANALLDTLEGHSKLWHRPIRLLNECPADVGPPDDDSQSTGVNESNTDSVVSLGSFRAVIGHQVEEEGRSERNSGDMSCGEDTVGYATSDDETTAPLVDSAAESQPISCEDTDDTDTDVITVSSHSDVDSAAVEGGPVRTEGGTGVKRKLDLVSWSSSQDSDGGGAVDIIPVKKLMEETLPEPEIVPPSDTPSVAPQAIVTRQKSGKQKKTKQARGGEKKPVDKLLKELRIEVPFESSYKKSKVDRKGNRSQEPVFDELMQFIPLQLQKKFNIREKSPLNSTSKKDIIDQFQDFFASEEILLYGIKETYESPSALFDDILERLLIHAFTENTWDLFYRMFKLWRQTKPAEIVSSYSDFCPAIRIMWTFAEGVILRKFLSGKDPAKVRIRNSFYNKYRYIVPDVANIFQFVHTPENAPKIGSPYFIWVFRLTLVNAIFCLIRGLLDDCIVWLNHSLINFEVLRETKRVSHYEFVYGERKLAVDVAFMKSLRATISDTRCEVSWNEMMERMQFSALVNSMAPVVLSKPFSLSDNRSVHKLWNLKHAIDCEMKLRTPHEELCKTAFHCHVLVLEDCVARYSEDLSRQSAIHSSLTIILDYIRFITNSEKRFLLSLVDSLVRFIHVTFNAAKGLPYNSSVAEKKEQPSEEERKKSLESVLKTSMPWIILARIVEDAQTSGNAIMHDVLDVSPESREERQIPLSLKLLIEAHEYWKELGFCNADNGVLMRSIINQTTHFLKLHNSPYFRRTLDEEIDQSYFCLYGHKKVRSSKGIKTHDCGPLSDLNQLDIPAMFAHFAPVPEPGELQNTRVTSELASLMERMLDKLPQSFIASFPEGFTRQNLRSKFEEIVASGKVNEFPKLSELSDDQSHLRNMFALLAIHYSKNEDYEKAVEMFILDVYVNPERFESWNGMTVCMKSGLDYYDLGSHEPPCASAVLAKANRVFECVKKCLATSNTQDEREILLLEVGSLYYNLSSFLRRDDKEAHRELWTGYLVKCKESLLQALKFTNDGQWLIYYYFGKIAHKLGDPPEVFLQLFIKSAEALEKDEAEFPKKINANTPQLWATEALEVIFRIFCSAYKALNDSNVETIFSVLESIQESAFLLKHFYGKGDKGSKCTSSQEGDNSADESEGECMCVDVSTREGKRRQVIQWIVKAIVRCSARYQRHFKSLYWLARISADELKDGKKALTYLMTLDPSLGFAPLFHERTKNNLFFNVYRIQSHEVDRPGNFYLHMAKATSLCIDLLAAQSGLEDLIPLITALEKVPSMFYMRECDRKRLYLKAVQAFSSKAYSRYKKLADHISPPSEDLLELLLIVYKFSKLQLRDCDQPKLNMILFKLFARLHGMSESASVSAERITNFCDRKIAIKASQQRLKKKQALQLKNQLKTAAEEGDTADHLQPSCANWQGSMLT